MNGELLENDKREVHNMNTRKKHFRPNRIKAYPYKIEAYLSEEQITRIKSYQDVNNYSTISETVRTILNLFLSHTILK